MSEQREVFFECTYCLQECEGDLQVVLVRNPGEEEAEGTTFFAHYGCFQRSLHPERGKRLDELLEVDLGDD